ncbi:FMN-linked oxidoreductases superfamily protein isoform 1 [Hibiscus syriacus]|uniref:FMN-linked oxidoreductases superfamily protein isoform 1 n=1 Tax=Hibiscus syriacus TaxID=106335 RepID=A0A6A3CJL3_HIBSY|nr:FMN-linked oxidoreductases superfamily protein isoform 1 [Hibiscus syriacus]
MAFVRLPFSDMDLLGIEVDDNTLIPGLAVTSSPWMNGLEVCSVEANTGRGGLILSVGISTCYVYVMYKKTPTTTSEAEAWEAEKKACGGLHFLASRGLGFG